MKQARFLRKKNFDTKDIEVMKSKYARLAAKSGYQSCWIPVEFSQFRMTMTMVQTMQGQAISKKQCLKKYFLIL